MPQTIYFSATVVAADGNLWTSINSIQLQLVDATDDPSSPATTTQVFVAPVPVSPAGSGAAPTTPPLNATAQLIETINENAMDEKIVAVHQQKQQLLSNDDVGSEGEWSMQQEQQRVGQLAFVAQAQLNYELSRLAAQQAQQAMIQFEMAAREANG
jgi:hypothetical protein